MWLNRYSGQSSPSTPSPAPQRRPSHLAPNPLPQRPGLTPRASSLSLLINGSTDSLPPEARQSNGSSLRFQVDSSSSEPVTDPLDALHGILATSRVPHAVRESVLDEPALDHVDFGDLSLQEFAADDGQSSLAHHDEPSSPSFEECRLGHAIP